MQTYNVWLFVPVPPPPSPAPPTHMQIYNVWLFVLWGVVIVILNGLGYQMLAQVGGPVVSWWAGRVGGLIQGSGREI